MKTNNPCKLFYDSNNQPAMGKRFGVQILARWTLQPLVGATDQTTDLISGRLVKATIEIIQQCCCYY